MDTAPASVMPQGGWLLGVGVEAVGDGREVPASVLEALAEVEPCLGAGVRGCRDEGGGLGERGA
jgi:hypothetical protein